MSNNLGNNEFNNLRDDLCAQEEREFSNNKKLKFVTTNFRDLLNAKEAHNIFGMTVRDQLFVPAEKIDSLSDMRNGKTGGIITNQNVPNNFGALPLPTLPSRYQMFHGDVDVEDTFRNLNENNKKSCLPSNNEFFTKSFYIFNDAAGIETPAPIKSVETKEFGPRGGFSTRFTSRQTRK